MGLLDYFQLGGAPQFGKPDTSHFEGGLRIQEPDIAPPYRAGRQGLFSSSNELSSGQMEKAYRSTVFFLANYRARNFARHMLDLAVERRTSQNEYEPVDVDHPWAQLLRRPNDYMPPLEFYLWMFLNRDLSYGAHFIVEHELLEGVEVPAALHPVFDSYGRVTPILDGVGATSAWVFRPHGREPVRLRPQDVVRVAHESPFERGKASTLIEAAAFEIDEAHASAVYARDAASDQGKPEVLLEGENEINPREGNRISRLFAQKYRSGSQSAGVPWTSGGLKAKQFQLTQRDMQFLEMRGFNKSQLYEIFEVQESLFSDEAYATGRNAAFRHFAQNTIQPNLEITVSQLEHGYERIFRADPAELRLAVPDAIPVDQKLQAEIDDVRIKNGTRTINEARRRDGEEEVEGGDDPLVNGTLTPLSAIGAGF